ncbi:hypothetical protein FGB62_130g143 [Gracilaria domingensis]|nr:hypothetical protein FGB62_130g143 [Gracilaria domingensis]
MACLRLAVSVRHKIQGAVGTVVDKMAVMLVRRPSIGGVSCGGARAGQRVRAHTGIAVGRELRGVVDYAWAGGTCVVARDEEHPHSRPPLRAWRVRSTADAARSRAACARLQHGVTRLPSRRRRARLAAEADPRRANRSAQRVLRGHGDAVCHVWRPAYEKNVLDTLAPSRLPLPAQQDPVYTAFAGMPTAVRKPVTNQFGTVSLYALRNRAYAVESRSPL